MTRTVPATGNASRTTRPASSPPTCAVRADGVELAVQPFDDIPLMTFADAALCEPALADELRDRGFIVDGLKITMLCLTPDA